MASSVQANINNSRNATGRLLQKAAYKIELPEEYQNNSSTKTQMIPALEVVVDLKPSNVKYEAVTKLRQGVGCTDPLWNVKYYSRANCLEEDFAQIHLQFLWMPRNIYRRATKQRVQRKPEVRISHRFAQSPTTAVA
ncbi:hypothetical protein BFJ63_vAg2484 [Fusarium oxysporum f. sp. narcissi]|uniref:Uncharacterized protein n=1 Tax=Fusarium oxysporum f. sp. narcissi TaxID=451672 RepID=A0A4Q2W4N0_FUSOX|nr:hypothetical protein BFJ63_vAg2484 [Fusarium oxysporum f. sp. narcissi]